MSVQKLDNWQGYSKEQTSYQNDRNGDATMDFLVKEQASPTQSNGLVWCVLIVDDDPEVHAVTRLALRNFQFEDRDIHIIRAYSGKEAE